MKRIKYKISGSTGVWNPGTGEVEWKDCLIGIACQYSEANEETAREKAYNGEYTIEDDGAAEQITAPRNIVSGEFVTIGGVLYLATGNIPRGEPVIVGQNAVETTIEQQLYEMKGE